MSGKKHICPKCGKEMDINEWNGWRYERYFCASLGDLATDEEIKENEKQIIKSLKE